MIPPGCTGLGQPLDVSVNKPMKDELQQILEDALHEYEVWVGGEDLRAPKSETAVGKKRILITQYVGQAWESFCIRKMDLIVKTFRSLGLYLPIDGSCDNELSIKGIPQEDLGIGDWSFKGKDSLQIERWGEKDVTNNILSDSNDEPDQEEDEMDDIIGEQEDENEGIDFVD